MPELGSSGSTVRDRPVCLWLAGSTPAPHSWPPACWLLASGLEDTVPEGCGAEARPLPLPTTERCEGDSLYLGLRVMPAGGKGWGHTHLYLSLSWSAPLWR